MLAIARGCACEWGVRNVTFVQADAEALAFAPGAFDLVTCTYGLMFCPAPARALEECRRVLEPGGTAAIVVWDQPSSNPFFTVMLRTIARSLALPRPGPDAPTGFRFAAAGALESVLHEAGFADATVERVPMTLVCESLEAYWSAFLDLSVGLRDKLAALPEADAARLQSAVADAAAPFVDRGRLALTASSLCALAKK
jgi:SAM-dependent methyltransferase